MIITIAKDMSETRRMELISTLKQKGFEVLFQNGIEYDMLLLTETSKALSEADIRIVDGVIDVYGKSSYHLVSRAFHPLDTVVQVGTIGIGQSEPIVMIAGPCSVESKEGVLRIAEMVHDAKANILRGGAFKPRTSPYAFQGMQEEGIHALHHAGKVTNMPIVSELVKIEDLPLFEKEVDMIQIGARNMANYEMLKAVGRTKMPVLLKRGMGATVEEWILAAEYILKEGNPNVVLCERGIRTFEKGTRSTLDLSSVPIVKEKTHLPIIVDPSHAVGDWRYVKAMSLAAIAAGADGIIVEVHDNPLCALSDGAQSLKADHFKDLVDEARLVAKAVGRQVR